MYEIHNQPIRKANDCAITPFDQSETLLNDSSSEYRATSAALQKKKTNKLEEEVPRFAFSKETKEDFSGKQENKSTRAKTNL